MKFVELVVLLPCHSLEDFPVHQQGTDAEGLLAAWSALWHPGLIAASAQMPAWYRADAPPEDVAGKLLIVPKASESLLLAGWASRAKTEGALVLRKMHRRDELIAAALAELDANALPRPVNEIDPELVSDFLALGTAYLLVELLTRQMRYMSNLDEIHLRNEVLAGAKAAAEGDGESARRHLRNCFEALTEARERFYPVNCYLVDLTLVADTTLGESLRAEMNGTIPINLLISGEVVEALAAREPRTLDTLRLALDHKRVAIVGGEYREGELPLLPRETLLATLQHGLGVYQQHLGVRPVVYGRRRTGLSPILPGVLEQLGFIGALHVTLDDGQFPQSPQCKTRWQGLDTGAIDALCRVPLDARSAESILSFPRMMGESMDNDHVATVAWAHWPGQVSPFYDDLRRLTNYGAPLGQFVALDAYFSDTDRPGDLTQFRADQYRSAYLKQAIIRQQADCLSRHQRRYELQAAVGKVRAADALARLLATDTPATSPPAISDAAALERAVESDAAAQELGARLDQFARAAVVRLAESAAAKTTTPRRGVLVVNPQSTAQRTVVDVSSLANPPDVAGPVLATQTIGDKSTALVETPGFGFSWLVAGAAAPAAQSKGAKRSKPLAEANVLRNEHCEVTLNPVTGAIKSVYTVNSRRNRLAQQLAFRLPQSRPEAGSTWSDPDDAAVYSTMACDELKVLANGPGCGRLQCRGRLLAPDGRALATFQQQFEIWRGSRILWIEIELELDELPRADPWNSYYAARFAWSDDVGELARGVGGVTQPTTGKRIEAPQFIELRAAGWQTTLLTGGLPYHLHTNDRMLDTLLVVRGESRRRFRLGVGFDSGNSSADALAVQGPSISVADVPLPAASSGQGWLLKVEARNAVATGLEAVTLDDGASAIRCRLLETAGQAGAVRLRCCRPPRRARHVDLHGATLSELRRDDDTVTIDLGACEWAMVELQF